MGLNTLKVSVLISLSTDKGVDGVVTTTIINCWTPPTKKVLYIRNEHPNWLHLNKIWHPSAKSGVLEKENKKPGGLGNTLKFEKDEEWYKEGFV